MGNIDEIAELRAELRHSHLTAAERSDAEARLVYLRNHHDEAARQEIVTIPPESQSDHKLSADP